MARILRSVLATGSGWPHVPPPGDRGIRPRPAARLHRLVSRPLPRVARRRGGRRGGARPTLVGLDGRARRRAAVRRASRPCGGRRQRRRAGRADGGAVHAGCGIRRPGARKRRLERRRAGARPALEGERGRRAGADRVGLAAGLARPKRRRVAWFVASWVIVGGAYAVARAAVRHPFAEYESIAPMFVGESSLTVRLTAVSALADVLRLLVFPLTLRVDYSPEERTVVTTPLDWRFAVGLVCAVAWVGALVVAWKRGRKLEAFGL